MNFYPKLFEASLVLSIIVVTNGEPTSCYYCNTEADGIACNTPVNTTALRTQICSNSTLSDATKDSTGVAAVCSKMSYVSAAGNFVTIRGCQSERLLDVEFCSYLKQQLSLSSISEFSCSVCSSDLCNSSSSPYISFVVLVSSVFLKVLF